MKNKRNNAAVMSKYGMPLCLLGLVILLQVFNMDVPLFSWLNIKNILVQNTAICLAALGLSLIMIAGEGDMSFAGMFSLLSVIFALIANQTGEFTIAFFAVLATALVTNILMTTLITKLNFSSFIVSIGFMFMAQGLEKALHQQTTAIQDPNVNAFVNVEIGLPLIVWIMLILFICIYVLVTKTKLGFQLRVVGENSDAGVEAGINIKRIKFIAYILAAILLGVAATIESCRVGAIYEQGKVYMLPIFSACYLGTSMFVPGRVNVMGTLFGAIFVGMINSFMKMMGVENYIIPIVQGIILVASVAISVFKRRNKITQVKV